MKLRCPYCRHEFGPDPVSICPHCGRTMLISDRLLKHPYRERKKSKDRIVREAARQRKASLPDPGFGRQPATIFFVLLVLLLVGAALLSRTGSTRRPRPARSRETLAGQELSALRIALERYRADCGQHPHETEGLKALVLDPGTPGWNGPYVNLITPDPWRTPYRYRRTNDTVRLHSNGPDGIPMTHDDI